MSRRRTSNTRRMKRHMMKELGGENFSAKVRRKLKEKETCKE